jgi:cellulose synthase/poly-beta-1,6-N-acetylglucosamine synthase-like glycosyltransferase
MAKVVFWLSFGFISYVYAGYPLLLIVWRFLAAKRVAKGAVEPFVSLVLAAHNERNTIAEKLTNCLALDYPRERLQIIVSLDGPTDGTEQIARQYVDSGVEVLHCRQHQGKAAAINRAMGMAEGEVIVFVDARQWIERTAVRELVANFQDRSVGAVSGELILTDSASSGSDQSADSVGLYWRYEKRLRALESDIHSMMGATGALYAIRRSLVRPLPQDTILDDVAIPMNAVLAGKRVVFDSAARVYDRLVSCAEEEFRRKVRTLMGNYQLLFRMPALLLPWRNPIFVQFVSHKVARLLAPYCFVALFVSNLFLQEWYYKVAMLLQVCWYLLAIAGTLLSRGFATTSQIPNPSPPL